MSFPQGGDFVRDVRRGINVVSSDPRVDQGDGVVYSKPVVSGNYISLLEQATVQFSHSLYPGPNFVSIFHYLYKPVFSTEAHSILAQVFSGIFSSSFLDISPAGVSSFWRLAQFNPGVLPRYDYVFSSLFAFDVASSFTLLNRLIIYMIEKVAARIKQDLGEASLVKSVVQTDYYTTISGSDDICVGDIVSPQIVYINPTASGLAVRPPTQIVEFDLLDAVGGVDLSTLRVELTSTTTTGTVVLVDSGADQTGGNVSIIGDPSSYRVRYIHPVPWLQNDRVVVTISGADLPPTFAGNPFYCGPPSVNFFVGDFPFQVWNAGDFGGDLNVIGDVDPPYISYSFPASGTSDNNIFGSVIIRVADGLTGVDLSSLDVSIDGVPIVSFGIPASEETVVTGSRDEYTVVHNPSVAFNYGSTVLVSVSASDLVDPIPNSFVKTYSFSFIEDSTLVIDNFKPSVGTHSSLESANIEVDIYDGVYGVDSSQCFFVINGTIVSGTQTAISGGINLSYHPPNDFEYSKPIEVTVHGVNGNHSAPAVKESFFTLFFGCRVLFFNEEPYNHFDSVDVFVRAKNNEVFYKDLSTGYFFTSYTQPHTNLGASITPVAPWANLSATVSGVGPEHRYGETVVVEFSVEDVEGHLLGPYTFSYTIEGRPD